MCLFDPLSPRSARRLPGVRLPRGRICASVGSCAVWVVVLGLFPSAGLVVAGDSSHLGGKAGAGSWGLLHDLRLGRHAAHGDVGGGGGCGCSSGGDNSCDEWGGGSEAGSDDDGDGGDGGDDGKEVAWM